MKRHLLLISLLSILLLMILIGCSSDSNKLPDSFTIELKRDSSSSGGNRYLDASLTFENNKIISGLLKYQGMPGTGGGYTCEYELDSSILTWVLENKIISEDLKFKEQCESFIPNEQGPIPLSKEGIQEKIGSGEYKPGKEPGHLETVYEIIE